MSASIRHIILIGLLLGPGCSAAQDLHWIEIAGSYYNPDWEFRESETGLRVTGHYQHGAWYAGATYNTIDTELVNQPGIVRLRGLPFGDWREVTLGRSLPLASSSSVQMEAAYQAVTLFDATESGYSLAGAVLHRFGPRVSGKLRLSYLQLEEQDWRLTGELLVATSKRSAVVARIDDFAEFDFTWYELGLRFFF